jgi:hypothetical protein
MRGTASAADWDSCAELSASRVATVRDHFIVQINCSSCQEGRESLRLMAGSELFEAFGALFPVSQVGVLKTFENFTVVGRKQVYQFVDDDELAEVLR